MSIASRIVRIETALEREIGGKIAVHYLDGRTQYLDGAQCVDLVFTAPGSVARFVSAGGNTGVLTDLLNGLL